MDIRRLALDELHRLSEIDRSERVRIIYRQAAETLTRIDVDWDVPDWSEDGEHHSVRALLGLLRTLACEAPDTVFLGAFEDGRLIGIAAWRPRLTEAMSQLAFLHVDHDHRRQGVASALCDEIDRLALAGGRPAMYVSASESESAVGFYTSRGFSPTATPNARLFAMEPEDFHMIRTMGTAPEPGATPLS